MNPNEGLAPAPVFAPTPEPTDDATVEFQEWTEESAGAAAAERMLAKYGSGSVATAPAAPSAVPPETESGLAAVGAVAKDIGRGLTESPRQVVGGVRDAAQATLDMWNDAGNWLEENVPLGRIDLGGGDKPSTSPQLPGVKQPTTVTGGLFRGVSQFVAGFFGAGKVGAALKLTGKIPTVLEAAIKGGVADFTVFDPHQERLSNLIQKFPELQNPVTDFLAADPNDTALEGRLKNAVEGLGLGVVAEGFIRTLKILRQARIAQAAEKPAGGSEVPPRTVQSTDFAPIGDPTGELFIQKKLDAAGRQAAATTPDQLRAAETAQFPKIMFGGRELTFEQARELSRADKLGDKPFLVFDTRKERGYEGVFPTEEAAKKYIADSPNGKNLDYGTPRSIEEMNPSGEESIAYALQHIRDIVGRSANSNAASSVKIEPDVFINFARIDAPEDIQKVMQTMADANAGTIRRNARGVRSWEQTKLSADQTNAWNTLMTRRQGAPLNAEQALAARQLWVTSATKLSEVSKLAAANPSEANLFAFRKMLATHYAIQSEVIAARTETARALNAWKIPAGEGAGMSRQLDSLIEMSGGIEVNRELAERVARLSDAGMATALEAMVKGSVWARTKNAVAQVWINALLTNPATHVVNAMSNWSVALTQIVERAGAARISKALGTQNGVELGEATAMAGAMVTSFGDALRAAWLTTKTGESAFNPGKVEVREGALSAEMWNVSKSDPLGMALNIVDVTTRTPGRLLGVGDEFFKTIGYRMELAAQAQRMAVQEVSAGTLSPLLVKKRVAEIMANPPESVKLDAVSAATYNTFTSKPAAALKKFGDGIHAFPILGRLLLPFKNTPINIMTYAAERSPMAPAVGAWRMDIAAGGARRDIALARVATGSAVMATTMDLAMSGAITGGGPSEPSQKAAWLRAGNQPYSIKVGDRWLSYGRLDPAGMTMGIAADIAEAMVNAGSEIDQKDFEDVMIQSMFAVANNVLSKTYTSGLSEAMLAVTRPKEFGDKYIQRVVGSFIPAGVASAARQVDPYMRTAADTVDALRRRIPGLSKDLPLYGDLWGRPVDYRSGEGALYDILSPVYIKKIDPEPVDTELMRLEYYPSMPDKRVSIDGVVVELDGKQYARFVQLAGNEAKDPAFGLGAKDFLNAVIGGENPYGQIYKLYSDGPDGGKAAFISKWIAAYREMAKKQMLAEDDGLKAQYEQRRKAVGSQFMPSVLGQ